MKTLALLALLTFLAIEIIWPIYARKKCSNNLRDISTIFEVSPKNEEINSIVTIWNYNYQNCLAHYGVNE